jgi:hypothetical protein
MNALVCDGAGGDGGGAVATSYPFRIPHLDVVGQIAPTLRIAARTGLPALGFVIAAGVAATLLRLDPAVLTRDLASIGHVPPYYSAISSLGILCWAMTAVLCCFTALGVTGAARTFLIGAAALSALPCLDDLFMFHEGVFWPVFGIPQKVTYAVYMGLVALHIYRCRDYVLAGSWGALVLALGLMGSSAAVDVIFSYMPREITATFFEDSLKFVGIAVWLGYFWSECRRAFDRTLAEEAR